MRQQLVAERLLARAAHEKAAAAEVRASAAELKAATVTAELQAIRRQPAEQSSAVNEKASSEEVLLAVRSLLSEAEEVHPVFRTLEVP
mmetsp:Transcript_71305/g.195416  ORF Transcript_71305/g.195416 Transcript_71305/m.195416 type:complete len:88 (-) Transcript_71305:185-448(-)